MPDPTYLLLVITPAPTFTPASVRDAVLSILQQSTPEVVLCQDIPVETARNIIAKTRH